MSGAPLERARKLAALSGGPSLRRLAAARILAEVTPELGVQLLHQLCRDAHPRGDTTLQLAARISMAALMEALSQEAASRAESLLAAAREQGLDEVAALFTRAAAVHELDPLEASRRDARQFAATTLGHLKWKARLARSPEELSRLATASEPSIVRNLLLNPRLTEEVVVRLAARRPVRPEVLTEIWQSNRWNALHAVRRALVFNPYLVPSLGTQLVPLLQRPDWRALSRDGSVHAEVRAQARRLLDQAEGGPEEPESSTGSERVGVTSIRSSPRDARRNE